MNKPTLAHLKRRFTVLDALQAPKLIFCQLTLKPGVSHNQSVEAKKVNFPTSLNAHPHIAKISVS